MPVKRKKKNEETGEVEEQIAKVEFITEKNLTGRGAYGVKSPGDPTKGCTNCFAFMTV